ncbi:uncharacterized protein LOC119997302 [Tripterygium wilfordii]|uniref:uncharacterized protein LOC119997302 n=1 Tax=Tripterygium wilfordii TaxID=458696 RepID=UPI0018F7FFC7|nr:uncharacterized protein LOC119997302 [Tripterygium wilfordii]
MPIPPSGSLVLDQVKELDVVLGKKPPSLGRKRKQPTESGSTSKPSVQYWRKKNIFFNLPYWEKNIIHHNLDVMHIEKNVCDNVLGTLLNDPMKTKDHLKARKDLRDLNIRPELWPQLRGSSRTYLPPACFTLSNEEKVLVCKLLKNVKVPDGFASNISRCVDIKHQKISGLKSHDCHIIMEQLLPLAIRVVLPYRVSCVIIEFSCFFKELCSKVLQVDELETLQNRIVHMLCQMERIFPPSFFTVMVHLVIHLADEAKKGGPVHHWWMYPIERYLGHLKSYVRNRARAHPKGSIAEGYIADECLTFCSRYLDGVETRFNRPRRVHDNNDLESPQGSSWFPTLGQPNGGSKSEILDEISRIQAHRYILFNCEEVDKFQKQLKWQEQKGASKLQF